MYQDVKFWVVSLLEKKYHSECHSGREVLQSEGADQALKVIWGCRGEDGHFIEGWRIFSWGRIRAYGVLGETEQSRAGGALIYFSGWIVAESLPRRYIIG